MAVKTWNGSDGSFASDSNWTPRAAPAAGDTAVITAGRVIVSGMLPGALTIALSSSASSSPVLIMSGATLAATSQLNMRAAGANSTLRLSGTVRNAGTITAAGASPGLILFQIDDAAAGGPTSFVNTGLIQVSNTNFQIATAGSNAADQFENDGVVSLHTSYQAPMLAYVGANIVGTGTVLLGAAMTFEAVQAVGAGQTIAFEPGIRAYTTLRIDSAAQFAAAISGFVSSDAIQLTSGRWDKAAYAATSANGGLLTLSMGGIVAATIAFKGSYSINSFNMQASTPIGSSQTSTTITAYDPLFSEAYYLQQNPDVAAAGVDPYQHFMASGFREARSPNPLFDLPYYLRHNPDIAASGLNPLTHFEQYGWREGRDPSLLFSTTKYLAAYQDAKATGLNPLQHYLQYGPDEGKAAFPVGGMAAADPLVDPAFYDRQLGATIIPAGIAGQQQAAWSYGTTGWQTGLNPDAYFDNDYYLAQNPDIRASGIAPLMHFELYGWHEGREPSLLFSGAKYLAANADVRASGINPLLHYLLYGRGEGRIEFISGGAVQADPLIDANYYDRQLGATLVPTGTAAERQAASSYGDTGWKRGLNPDAFFDTKYYLDHNPDVAAANYDPLKHYEQYGWHEGRDPSAQFSTSKYLAAYSDVRAAGINPLEHFLLYGHTEGRIAASA